MRSLAADHISVDTLLPERRIWFRIGGGEGVRTFEEGHPTYMGLDSEIFSAKGAGPLFPVKAGREGGHPR